MVCCLVGGSRPVWGSCWNPLPSGSVDANEFAYFSDQVAAGKVILFTGAGFSLQAQAENGQNVPTASQLLHELWPIVYGSAEYDESTLADVFGAAQQRHIAATRDLVNRRLRVSRENLPEEYRVWFSLPWYRVYTLNVDNLADVVQTEFELPRRIKSLSALTDPPPASTPDLAVVHLNGKVSDFPNITFSQRNYAERQAFADLWYPTLVRELATYAVLYIGSTLDEPPLWQYVEARPPRARGVTELRPKSFLVTKALPLGRQSLLGEFNIRYEEGTQEEFCAETLSQLSDAATRGHSALKRAYQAETSAPPFLSISDLASSPLRDAPELLFGREPCWPDITEGYAVERDFDRELLERVQSEDLRLVMLTGTAGSGKALTAMRLALALVAAGAAGYVYNSDFAGGIRTVRDAANNAEAKVVLITNANRFGDAMSDLLTALADDDSDRVVIATVRTTRRDAQALGRIERAGGVEFVVPPLADSDIAALLDSLTEARRLGDLEDKSRAQQEAVFRDKCGRQLLVAMIEATSGLRFDQKVASECDELDPHQLIVYAVLTLASAHDTSLDRNELLAACGGDPVATAAALKHLVDKHLVITSENARLAIRHRVIAERALDFFQARRSLVEPVRGLIFAVAGTTDLSDRRSRRRRLLNWLLNHATLIRLLFSTTPSQIDLDAVRSIYDTVEPLLSHDFHYWLQRGSFEVEEGDLGHANNYLQQARAKAPDDQLVLAEWGYLLLKRASQHASDPKAAEEAEEGFAILEEQIALRGDRDPYPYHIFGSQGLSWVKRSPMGPEARIHAFERLREVVAKGVERHPAREDLRNLKSDLETAYLNLAVSDGGPRPPGG